jgi:hypothetical protein
MFLAGQIAAALVVPRTAWQPPARFVEAAAGLTIAYLAVEILVLPKAGMRWLIVAVLGAFHGLYFELFLRTTGYRALYVLSGAVFARSRDRHSALLFSYLANSWRPKACACLRFRLIGDRHGLVLPAPPELNSRLSTLASQSALEFVLRKLGQQMSPRNSPNPRTAFIYTVALINAATSSYAYRWH